MKVSRRHFLESSLLLGLPISKTLLNPILKVSASPSVNTRRVSGAADVSRAEEARRVVVMRTPDDGIQPQVATDVSGCLHLIYFKGDPPAGNVFYVRKEPGAARFSRPLQVNSHPGSVIAVGSVRGAQVAVGKNGRVHVAWPGSQKAEPRGPRNTTPMLYTRLNDAGMAFEPQRNVMQYATGLDGGGSVAADHFGNVYVAWHANPRGNGEAHRCVYLARSTDDGKSFMREEPAYREATGACGCCGMRAFADERGAVYILYRTATELIHRDMELLISEDRGRNFTGRPIAKWTLDACPMSTDDISQGDRRVLAAWETAGQVYYDEIHPATLAISSSVAAPGPGGNRKHPSVAANAKGETLLAWTEGTAWQKGGSVSWQHFDCTGHPTRMAGRADGLPVWGLVAAVARPDGGFTIIY
jgi:hypothetical protein